MRLLAPLAALALLAQALAAPGDCVRSADHRKINALLSDGGPGTKVYLCPGVEYALEGTIVFTAADQELATKGYPSGDKRAVLRIASDNVATAIQGDCRRCARVAVRNLVIDGGRRVLGRVKDANTSPGLVIIGGNPGQSVRECRITDPRGFTAVHVREGAKLNCRGAIIERNEITGVGEEYDPAYDGPDPEGSPHGRPLADGISIACRDSHVRDNVLRDCTDAGIVVYCSPGTRIENNRISTEQRSAIGGILLVDTAPFKGDYSGVMVRDNTLDAAGRSMRVGIGLGLSVLSDDNETMLKGGSVIGNHLTGHHMGFGIAAAGLESWTIKDNSDEARYEGEPSERCFDEPANPPPQAFIYNSATLDKSSVQDGFFDSDFAYIVCIDGVGEKPVRYGAGAELLGEPAHAGKKVAKHKKVGPLVEEAVDTREALEDPVEILPGGLMSTGSSILDGILLHSQQRILDRIDAIAGDVELSLNRPSSQEVPRHQQDPHLNARLSELERNQAKLLKATRDVASAVFHLRSNVADVGLWEGDVLLSIQQEVESNGKLEREQARKVEEHYDDYQDDEYDGGLPDMVIRIILLGGFCSTIALCVRRYRGTPVRGKIV